MTIDAIHDEDAFVEKLKETLSRALRSLAHTAATLYQSSDGALITVSESSDGTFNSIIANIAYKALNDQDDRRSGSGH